MFALGDHNLATCFLLKILQRLSLKSGLSSQVSGAVAIGTTGFEGHKYHPKPGVSWECLNSSYCLVYSFYFQGGILILFRSPLQEGEWGTCSGKLQGTTKSSRDFSNSSLCFPIFPVPKSYHGPAPLLAPSLISSVKGCGWAGISPPLAAPSDSWYCMKGINSNKFDSNPIFAPTAEFVTAYKCSHWKENWKAKNK